jgi:hypothetical protein
MRQIILIAVLVLLLVGAGLILLLGAFPPHVTPQPVQVTIPNDHFQSH